MTYELSLFPVGRRGRGTVAVLFALVLVASLLTAVPVASAASETEPNDNRQNAESISIGETITGSTPTQDDEDWFKFTVQKGETINVTMSVASGTKVPEKIRLRDKTGDKVASTRVSGGTTESVGTTATYTGTYYVEVVYDFGNPSDYSFTVDTYTTDGFEPNEDRGNATRISVGTTQSGQTTIGDGDWFEFEAERGETINVTMTVAPCDTKCPDKIRLRKANGEKFDADGSRKRVSAGETDSVGITAPYTGTYYVEVAYDFGSPSEYNFTVDTYRTDPFEPNENQSLASPLFENPFTPAEAQLSIGDDDYFKYRLDAGETLRAVAGVPADAFDHNLELYRPGDDSPDKKDGVKPGELTTLELTAQSAGVHYVAMSRDNEDTGPYNITITAAGQTVGPPNDRFEAQAGAPRGNYDQQTATPIESGTYGNLGMVDDDEDWFRLRAAKDARVTVNTSYNTSANTLSVALVRADGTTVTSGGDSLARNVSAAGTYYVRVTGQANAQATYTLDVTVSAAGPGALPGQAAAPTDTDGDGRYEDVDGSGGLNVIDVSILLGVFDRVPTGEITFYDYNDDGSLNILDVAALLNET